MSPERKCTIKGHLIEEYYWSGKFICYVDHKASRLGYDATVKRISEGRVPLLVK